MTWTAQSDALETLPIESRAGRLPSHLKAIVAKAEETIQPAKIWLFGSRARGGARPNSDFDLAFEATRPSFWSQFVVEIGDDPPSLYRYDLVDVHQADPALLNSIHREGILIYERRPSP
jgi:CRISPR-associated protein Cmr1